MTTSVRRLAEWLVALSLLTVLAFHQLRFEDYETEKFGLLTILGGMVFVCLIFQHRLTKAWLKNPIVIGVGLFFLASIVATILSISPERSLWGSDGRRHGLLGDAMLLVLFLQASLSGKQLIRWLFPVVSISTILLSTWAILQYVDYGLERPPSMAGNANFLTGWLAMALLLLMTEMIVWRQQGDFWRKKELFVAIVAVVMGFLTMILAASRGAMLALAVGAVIGISYYTATYKKPRLQLVLFGVGCMAVIGFVWITPTLPPAEQNETGIERLLNPYSVSREYIWNAASTLIESQDQAVLDYNRQTDHFSSLRGWVGYGSETTDQLQLRFGVYVEYEQYLDRFHNAGFDTVVSKGVFGLAAYGLVWCTVIGFSFVRLRLLTPYSASYFPLVFVSTIVGSLVVLEKLLGSFSFVAILPLGIMVGMVLGLLFWLSSLAVIDAPLSPTLDQLYLIGFLAVIFCHAVDLTFTFSTFMTESLWWVVLGIVAAYLSDTPSHETDTPTPLIWSLVILASGLFILHSFGINFDQSFIQYDLGFRWLPLFIGILLLMGVLFVPRQWSIVLLIIGIWIFFWRYQAFVVDYFGDSLVDIFLQTPSKAAMIRPHLWLATLGPIALLLGVLGYWLVRQVSLRWYQLGVLCLGFIAGTLVYMSAFAASSLHNQANFSWQSLHPQLLVADISYEAALDFAPYSSDIRIDWLIFTANHVRSLPNDRQRNISEQVNALMDYHPFYQYSERWHRYIITYGYTVER